MLIKIVVKSVAANQKSVIVRNITASFKYLQILHNSKASGKYVSFRMILCFLLFYLPFLYLLGNPRMIFRKFVMELLILYITYSLKGVSSEPVKIDVKADIDAVVENIKNFVNSYNEMLAKSTLCLRKKDTGITCPSRTTRRKQ